MSKKVKVGLALGSGAARGWAHIGVIQQLLALDIEPDIICGSSIGSLVGAAYVAGNINKLEEWVSQLDKLKTARYFTINRSLSGFVNKERFRHFLDEYVVSADLMIEKLDKPFATVATDLNTGREIWNMKGKVMESVMSSISLPGLFPAIKHDDRWLIDGGLVNPVPVSVCRALGADVVIAVNLNSDIVGKHFRAESPEKLKEKENKNKPDNPSLTDRFTTMVADYTVNLFNNGDDKDEAPDLMEAIAASINITQDRITRSRMAGDPPEIILSPRLSHIGILEFYRGTEAIEEGKASVDRHKRDFDYFLN